VAEPAPLPPVVAPAVAPLSAVNAATRGKVDLVKDVDDPEVGAAVATGVAITAAAGFGALLVRSRRSRLG